MTDNNNNKQQQQIQDLQQQNQQQTQQQKPQQHKQQISWVVSCDSIELNLVKEDCSSKHLQNNIEKMTWYLTRVVSDRL